MTQMTPAQLMRRYIKADPSMTRDFRAVCVERNMTSDQIRVVQGVFDLDNDCADPHDDTISVEFLEGWRVLISAQRRRNFSDREFLNETLSDLDVAIDAKKYRE